MPACCLMSPQAVRTRFHVIQQYLFATCWGMVDAWPEQMSVMPKGVEAIQSRPSVFEIHEMHLSSLLSSSDMDVLILGSSEYAAHATFAGASCHAQHWHTANTSQCHSRAADTAPCSSCCSGSCCCCSCFHDVTIWVNDDATDYGASRYSLHSTAACFHHQSLVNSTAMRGCMLGSLLLPHTVLQLVRCSQSVGSLTCSSYKQCSARLKPV